MDSRSDAGWKLETPAAPWTPRDSMGHVVYDGKMWILGGFIPQRVNDVWSSSDGKHVDGGDVRSALGGPQPAELRGVRRQDVDHGGRELRRQPDRQRPDRIQRRVELDRRREAGSLRPTMLRGATRSAATAIVFDDRIWIMGGMAWGNGRQPSHDVWYSDNGRDWRLATDYAPVVREVDADYGGVRRQDVGDRRRRLRRDGVRELTDKLPGRLVLHRRRGVAGGDGRRSLAAAALPQVRRVRRQDVGDRRAATTATGATCGTRATAQSGSATGKPRGRCATSPGLWCTRTGSGSSAGSARPSTMTFGRTGRRGSSARDIERPMERYGTFSPVGNVVKSWIPAPYRGTGHAFAGMT